jgi:transcription antitermination protein NusB
MKSRRQARVFAMQVLYSMEIGGLLAGDAISGVLSSQSLLPDTQQKYGIKLVDLYQQYSVRLQEWLQEYSQGWDLERMAVLDRILLCLALSELAFCPDVPPKVAINEAIEISRKYSSAESSSFINGILNAFARNHLFIQGENNV